jgi:hypothetical protein
MSPQPESHWAHSDVESQPPRDQVLSLRRLVQESRTRLGPAADPEAVLADLAKRGLDITRDDIRAVWDELT